MKLISVNVGLPRNVIWKGNHVTTGIFKQPVAGQVMVRSLNLDGDKQADLMVHGGRDKAVYAYPVEHYDYWQKELPGVDSSWGMFGENFTTVGLLEHAVNIGDRFRVGSAELMVTQPRMPCYKLGIKFGHADMVKRFLDSQRPGFYFSVLQEGKVQAGDAIELISRDENNLTVADVTQLYAGKGNSLEMLQRAVQSLALPASWRDYFQQQIARRN